MKKNIKRIRYNIKNSIFSLSGCMLHSTLHTRKTGCFVDLVFPYVFQVEISTAKFIWSSPRTCLPLRYIHYSNNNESVPCYVDFGITAKTFTGLYYE